MGGMPSDEHVDREWEVFLRESPGEPMQHVGSVSAATAETARAHAERLFGRFADALWLCPADAVDREREVPAA